MAYDLAKEKNEAIRAGERALDSLERAKKDLDSAGRWGLYDMIGGGFISSMIKRSRMNDAKNDMEQARYDLRNFSRELSDVEGYCNLNLKTDDFLTFADIFFDGFFVDLMMQSRISQAKDQVNEAIYRTREVLDRLRRL